MLFESFFRKGLRVADVFARFNCSFAFKAIYYLSMISHLDGLMLSSKRLDCISTSRVNSIE